jgi:hypothetical protein
MNTVFRKSLIPLIPETLKGLTRQTGRARGFECCRITLLQINFFCKPPCFAGFSHGVFILSIQIKVMGDLDISSLWTWILPLWSLFLIALFMMYAMGEEVVLKAIGGNKKRRVRFSDELTVSA